MSVICPGGDGQNSQAGAFAQMDNAWTPYQPGCHGTAWQPVPAVACQAAYFSLASRAAFASSGL